MDEKVIDAGMDGDGELSCGMENAANDMENKELDGIKSVLYGAAEDDVCGSDDGESGGAKELCEVYLARIAELSEALDVEREINRRRELEISASAMLSEMGLPPELKDVLVLAGDKARKTAEIILNAAKKTAEEQISARCRTSAPATGAKAYLTKSELARLPVAELQRLRDIGASLQ